ncbi:MAG: transcriptional regulator [Deltaproteobacteria bacterium]|nr:transcriptional regulator [Deltaproteobacteria bacterium]
MKQPALSLRLLGPLTVSRDGVAVPLPRSRKVRALLAFLALTRGPVGRSRLCDLLWEVPNDPRSELRWCLSKIRGVLGPEHQHRVVTTGNDLVALDTTGCHVDAHAVDAIASRIGEAAHGELVEACDSFRGDLLDGLHVDGSPELDGWLAAQRHRYRGLHIALLEALARRSPSGSDETFRRLEAWLRLAPFDAHAHEVLLEALVQRGRLRDANEHLAATIRAFEHEGVDWLPLRERWLAARAARPEHGRAAAAPSLRVETEAAAPIAVSSDGPRHLRAPEERLPTRRRASVAVMPFVDRTPGQPERTRIGDGLTEDVITRLAKLRALFVIARGTVYALSERNIGHPEAGRILNVEYVVSGSLRRVGDRLSVSLELVETHDARIVWTDELHCVVDDACSVLDPTIDRIVATIAEEIETAECHRAVLKAPSSLDAWEAYHRGLWHMYKFNGPDNRDAERFFRASLEIDPTFARAYAGLSFTHFQNAFLDLTPDREHQIEQAFDTAVRSVGTDDRDPAAHWAMGRALWLRGGRGDESLAELRRSVELSPNFALGHYTLGFVHAQAGDPRSAIDATDHSRELSPFDPLQFAMLATRAIAQVRLGQLDEAAEWAVKATARPNAHAHILAIAVGCLVLTNRRDEARAYVARIRRNLPSYTVEDFLRSFRFEPETERTFRRSARQVGFD